MVNAKIYKFLICILLVIVHISCKKNSYISEVNPKANSKMVLVYMEANNNLKSDAMACINAMENGFVDIDGVLLVYIKSTNGKSYLLKIKHDLYNKTIISDTVKVFENEDLSNPIFLKSVIEYSQMKYPADSYGLILWSHATSWAPPKLSKANVESFGSDRGKEMDIIELKNALPDNFDFIIFDACSMASLEVVYEFKDKAKYIIASPSETIAESFPYQKITPFLFGNSDNLKRVAIEYFNHYNAYKGDMQSGTISLVKTSELKPLADKLSFLIQNYKKNGEYFISKDVQRMDFSDDFPVAAYDFGDFLRKNFDSSLLMDIQSQLDNTILYKSSTSHFLGKPIINFSGVTCYIPLEGDENLSYYKRLSWYSYSGLHFLYEK